MNRDRNNFDILRLILSLIVVIVHTAELTKIRDIEAISSYFSSVFAVDAFFIVSGFLIFMSFDKSSSYINYLLKIAIFSLIKLELEWAMGYGKRH